MPYGFSYSFVQEVYERAQTTPKGQDVVLDLCLECIKQNIMLSDAAEQIGVSKQTIYNWMKGAYKPRDDATASIKQYLQRIKKKG